MNAFAGFFTRRRKQRLLQPVAPDLPNSSWVKDVLKGIDFGTMEPPPAPEPAMDYWLVDNAARVADNTGDLPNDR